MSKVILYVFTFLIHANLLAQSSISNNGRYVCVSEDKTMDQTGRTLVIQSTTGSWKKEIKSGSNAQFVSNSKEIVYKIGDSLVVLTLGTDKRVNISDVVSYKLQSKA